MENPPSFDRIVGGTEKQKDIISQQAEKASAKSGKEIFGEYLLEPTEEEKTAIENATVYANSIAKQYGAKRQYNTDRIFLLEPGSVFKLSNKTSKGAFCNRFNQAVGVEKVGSSALLAKSVVHELLHLNSYSAAQVVDEKYLYFFTKTGNKPYRSGITMRGRNNENEYFSIADEAIVATFTKKYFNEVLSKDSKYKEEIERTQEIKQWLLNYVTDKESPEGINKTTFVSAIQDILVIPQNKRVYKTLIESAEDDDYKFGFFVGFYENELENDNIFHERYEERQKFDAVLTRIVKESKGKIADKNEIFDVFARAHFTGNYFTLARTIDDVLGKGSFRKIAEELGELEQESQN